MTRKAETMKIPPATLAVLAACLTASSLAAARPQAADASPQPVEIRVRVSSEGRFLDDLTLGDFSLREDGQSLTPRSLSLVRNGQIVRRDGGAGPAPKLERSYTLLFQAVDWDPKLDEAIDHLFRNVLRPGDSLTLVTPVKPYNLQKDALAVKSKAQLSKGMEEVLRKDILRGGGEFRGLISELKRLTKAIAGDTGTFQEDLESDVSTEADSFGLEMQIDRYRQSLMKLEGIRLVDEAKLLAFAASLKPQPGQKTVILFYQREFRPEISPQTMNRLMALYQDNPDVLGDLMELFQFYKREKRFDSVRVRKAFADAGIDFHFVFMERKNQRVFGATMREQSEDTFPGFVDIAKATGGTVDSSSNVAAAFKRAAEASSDYYLLGYVPSGGGPSGAFRQVEIEVKRPGCLVTNPAGYFAK
jgi:hypothetical protein